MTSPADAASSVTDKATALLEEIKALPLADRETFAKLFHAWKTADRLQPVGNTSKEDVAVKWPDFAGRLRKLFPDGPIPGDPQKFWDVMRRE